MTYDAESEGVGIIRQYAVLNDGFVDPAVYNSGYVVSADVGTGTEGCVSPVPFWDVVPVREVSSGPPKCEDTW